MTSTARPTTRCSRSRCSTASARRELHEPARGLRGRRDARARAWRRRSRPSACCFRTRPRTISLVQVRVITADAPGSDEWVGDRRHLGHGRGRSAAGHGPVRLETSPGSGGADVPRDANVEITFSEPVTVGTATFSISCTTSGAHPFALSRRPGDLHAQPGHRLRQRRDLHRHGRRRGRERHGHERPAGPHGRGLRVQLQHGRPDVPDLRDPGREPTSRRSPAAASPRFPASSPRRRSNGFFMQDATGDGNRATSDGIFVFTGSSLGAVRR